MTEPKTLTIATLKLRHQQADDAVGRGVLAVADGTMSLLELEVLKEIRARAAAELIAAYGERDRRRAS